MQFAATHLSPPQPKEDGEITLKRQGFAASAISATSEWNACFLEADIKPVTLASCSLRQARAASSWISMSSTCKLLVWHVE